MPESCSTAQSSSTHLIWEINCSLPRSAPTKRAKRSQWQDSIKDNVINQIKTVKVLADHADDYKVKLQLPMRRNSWTNPSNLLLKMNLENV